MLVCLAACSPAPAAPRADAAMDASAPDAADPSCPCGDAGTCAPSTEVCIANTHDHPGIGIHTEHLCAPIPAECTPTSDCACIQSSFCTCLTGPACWTVACHAP